ncbi:hypothetical protein D3C78_1765550 [compost metagenome]
MLFTDLLCTPAFWAIKFHHVTLTIFVHKLIDAVFIAVERRQPRINTQTYPFQRIHNQIGRKGFKIKCRVVHDNIHFRSAASAGK